MATPSLIESIKILRDRTGAGMMDCKKALEENGCDIEKAADWLREKGIAKAQKKASRIAAEGKAIIKVCSECGKAVIVEVNCETDFVSRGDDFEKLVYDTAAILLEKEPKTIEEAKELTATLYQDAVVKIGEKIDLRRFEIIHKEEGKTTGSYIHMKGKIAVGCVIEGNDLELADNLAMHIAANAPLYVDKSEIPAEVKAKEMEIEIEASKNDPKLAGKPQNILEKILEGKVNKTLFASVLKEQPYILDDSKTVGAVLAENKTNVVKMIRYVLGEGIEKRQDDFAAEVMSQCK